MAGQCRELLRAPSCTLVVMLLLSFSAQFAQAQRVRYTINEGWRFRPDGVEFAEKGNVIDDAGWERVNLPHTWNAHDPFDDVPSYRRGVSWYRRRLPLADSLRGKRLALHFEGANQVATVYVNGAFVGRHVGGYTAFTVDFTKWAKFDGRGNEQLVAVQVDNAHDPFVAPLSVGFALYGGIYRDVWLVATDPVHVTTADHGASGVYVTTPIVSAERAAVQVRGALANASGERRSVRVVSTLLDKGGATVAEQSSAMTLEPGREGSFVQRLPEVARPRLWSPEDPYLYTVVTDVRDGDRLVDRVTSPVGFRWFRFTPDSGFFLNGRKYVLRGTNRHQDQAGLGSALTDRQHVRDLEWIKAMGANFLRLAHYPQDPAVLDAADRLGLLVWEEIPVVNHITVADEFTANAERMLREMVRQHHNHPSVVMWGTMNEVFLWGEEGARVQRITDTTYRRQVRDFARRLDALTRREDPARATTMAIHGSVMYDSAGIADVPQVLGLNLYNGWYSGTIDEFGRVLDRRHREHPKHVIFISEYGSGSDLRLNSDKPERFDHSGTYHRLFHEGYLRQANARPYLAGTAIWNQFDFSQPHIGESMPQMNQKGMLTFDRKPKDVFYLYKANWNPAPMVYVASRDWAHRGMVAAEGQPLASPVDVYSNASSVELFVNGRSLGSKTPDDVRKASWEVPFAEGDNVLDARATVSGVAVVDRMTVRMERWPADLRADTSARAREIAVNVGSNAQFRDDDGLIWLEDRAYAPGSFGFLGGERALMARDVVVTGTVKTGMYVTYRTGLQGYRFDVPAGDYELELHFAEPAGTAAGARVFDVKVNGTVVMPAVDLAARTGTGRALVVAQPVAVRGDEGIVVSFDAKAGQAVLNAIRVRKDR